MCEIQEYKQQQNVTHLIKYYLICLNVSAKQSNPLRGINVVKVHIYNACICNSPVG